MNVFLSYVREDEPYARRLQEVLQRRGIDVFSDMSIMPGERWQAALRKMVDDAGTFILITSKSSADSESVDREVVAAVSRASYDPNVRIIPVVLDRHAKPSPLLSRYQFIRPEVAKDLDRVADLVQESLDEPVTPPDLNLEHEILETERANLELEISARYSAIHRSWGILARALSIAGLIAGIVATVLVAVLINYGPQIGSLVIAVVSVLSSTLAGAVAFYSRRSRNGR